ncbi:MAG: hypothetical protein Q8S26_09930 [Azonexus sp.]|nr:hypothetical protein [Azonexus sp.]
MPVYGSFPAYNFTVTNGSCADCAALPQALWFFRHETIAVPNKEMPVAGFDRTKPVVDDLSAWVAATPVGSNLAYPPLIWLGAPESVRHAQLAADGLAINVGENNLALRLAPRLPLNHSWFDASSQAFFCGQPLKMRGNREGENFVARTFWPENFCLPESPASVSLSAEPAAVRDWVRAQPRGGAQSQFAVESIWRRPGGQGPRAGQPILGLMLNGAQGDDDEAHSGHFALMTGRIGAQGAIDDWLVNNFYSLDSESEKGIIAAPVPLDNYLGDLNSGQAWYRPSYMLVASLRDGGTAVHLQSALGRVFNQFYRHQFVYQHARANCAGMSVTTSRTLGWQVPVRGPESWLKAVFGLPLVAIREGSLNKGRAIFDYLTEDQTRLYPAAAFEEMTADLLKLVAGQTSRKLTEFERRLAEDVEEILLVRVPQFPSSRAWGDWPAVSSVEYQARVPKDPAQQQIIPVPPRPFPAELRDPQTPAEPWRRSDYAVAAWAMAIVALFLLILRQLLA